MLQPLDEQVAYVAAARGAVDRCRSGWRIKRPPWPAAGCAGGPPPCPPSPAPSARSYPSGHQGSLAGLLPGKDGVEMQEHLKKHDDNKFPFPIY